MDGRRAHESWDAGVHAEDDEGLELKRRKPSVIRMLGGFGRLLPGDYLKTAFYLNLVFKPRVLLRSLLQSFYRMDHIYQVLGEFKARYKGEFAILEFGTSDGYAFTKLLYATRYLGLEDRVRVYGFDSFEGMPEARGPKDRNLITGEDWVQGQFKGRYQELDAYCRSKYSNYRLVKGYFEDSLDEAILRDFQTHQPILVWIDCDYYTSASVVLQRMIPYIPNGCVIYFDEYEFNYGSRLTGEARLVHEINEGRFGDGIELVLDTELSWNSKRVYRFINLNARTRYRPAFRVHAADVLHRRGNDSPLP